jgi:hypothetical protein
MDVIMDLTGTELQRDIQHKDNSNNQWCVSNDSVIINYPTGAEEYEMKFENECFAVRSSLFHNRSSLIFIFTE